MCQSASAPQIHVSFQSNRALNHIINILDSSSPNFVWVSDIIDTLCFNAQKCLLASFLQLFIFLRLSLTMNDIEALFLMPHFATDCPIRAFVLAPDLSVNDGPVGWTVHSLQTADERLWNMAWHSGNFHHSRRFSHSSMQMSNTCLGRGKNLGQAKHACSPRQIHSCLRTHPDFPHFLLYFCFSRALSALGGGVWFFSAACWDHE